MDRKLVEVAWEITDRCNLNCIHCYNPRLRTDLEVSHVFRILDELKEMQVQQVKYGGGEPLLREDFLDILEKTISSGISTSFSTNGMLISEELASRIKELGLWRVQVSLDGNEEIHNRIRQNKESYDKASNAIKLFVNYGMKVSVATTLMKLNVNCLENLFNTCRELRVNRWRVMKYIPSERKDLMPSIQEYREAHLKLLELKNKTKDLDVFVAREFDELCDFESQDAHDFRCFGGRTVMSIKSNGDVSPCSYFPYRLVGNLKYKKVKELWNCKEILGFAEECYGDKNCKHFNLCQGGCKAASFYASGKQRCDPYCWVKED